MMSIYGYVRVLISTEIDHDISGQAMVVYGILYIHTSVYRIFVAQ
jgi:hypothetical protein